MVEVAVVIQKGNAKINSFIPICISNTILRYHYLSLHLRAYNRPTQRLAPSCPDSSTDGALHRHRRGQGSNPRSGLNFSGLSGC